MITRLSQSRLALTGLFVLAALIGAGILFAMQTWLPGGDRARIEAVVHDYVLEHPELIPQAIQRLQDRETGRVIAANKAAIRSEEHTYELQSLMRNSYAVFALQQKTTTFGRKKGAIQT